MVASASRRRQMATAAVARTTGIPYGVSDCKVATERLPFQPMAWVDMTSPTDPISAQPVNSVTRRTISARLIRVHVTHAVGRWCNARRCRIVYFERPT